MHLFKLKYKKHLNSKKSNKLFHRAYSTDKGSLAHMVHTNHQVPTSAIIVLQPILFMQYYYHLPSPPPPDSTIHLNTQAIYKGQLPYWPTLLWHVGRNGTPRRIPGGHRENMQIPLWHVQCISWLTNWIQFAQDTSQHLDQLFQTTQPLLNLTLPITHPNNLSIRINTVHQHLHHAQAYLAMLQSQI